MTKYQMLEQYTNKWKLVREKKICKNWAQCAIARQNNLFLGFF